MLRYVPVSLRDRLAGVRIIEFQKRPLKYGRDVRAMTVLHPKTGVIAVCFFETPAPWIVMHEVGHVIDFQLREGGGEAFLPRRSDSPDVQAAFRASNLYISSIASRDPGEWFAEGLRAWYGENRGYTLRPATRDDVRVRAPTLAALFTNEGFV